MCPCVTMCMNEGQCGVVERVLQVKKYKNNMKSKQKTKHLFQVILCCWHILHFRFIYYFDKSVSIPILYQNNFIPTWNCIRSNKNMYFFMKQILSVVGDIFTQALWIFIEEPGRPRSRFCFFLFSLHVINLFRSNKIWSRYSQCCNFSNYTIDIMSLCNGLIAMFRVL